MATTAGGVRAEVDLSGRVQEALTKLLGARAGRVVPGASLTDDLEVDSLVFMELVVGLEREFAVRIPDREAARLKTVDDVTEAIRRAAG